MIPRLRTLCRLIAALSPLSLPPLGLPAGALAADRLHEAAASKPFGSESLGISANLIREEGFEPPAESMPELLDLLSRPAEAALAGLAIADELSARLGLTGCRNGS